MRYGSLAQNPSWVTMLRGSILAGIGLGLTNTPVTNTTTGSVSSNRAGMASGIDMSARLITLAINIALMGFILVEGILSYLKTVFPHQSLNKLPLRSLAEKVASGSFHTLKHDFPQLAVLDPSGIVVHTALVQGFDWIMLYGGIGVWILSLASLITFGKKEVHEIRR
ncbi:hypothetical protein [Pedobacter sp. NJ-S-72]